MKINAIDLLSLEIGRRVVAGLGVTLYDVLEFEISDNSIVISKLPTNEAIKNKQTAEKLKKRLSKMQELNTIEKAKKNTDDLFDTLVDV